MAAEGESAETTRALDEVYRTAIAIDRTGTRNTADMSEVFRQLDNVTAARRLRLHLASGLVPNIIWFTLFAGAFLTVGFTLFFGSENLSAQLGMTCVLSVLVTFGLVVICPPTIPSPGRCISFPIRSRACSPISGETSYFPAQN